MWICIHILHHIPRSSDAMHRATFRGTETATIGINTVEYGSHHDDNRRCMSLIYFGDVAALLPYNAEVEGSSPSLTPTTSTGCRLISERCAAVMRYARGSRHAAREWVLSPWRPWTKVPAALTIEVSVPCSLVSQMSDSNGCH
jgi:hypothetical protein